MLIRFWVLSTMLLRNPKLAQRLGLISWVLIPVASSLKGYIYVSFGWFRLAGHLSKWKHETLLHPEQAEISTLKIKLGDLPR